MLVSGVCCYGLQKNLLRQTHNSYLLGRYLVGGGAGGGVRELW